MSDNTITIGPRSNVVKIETPGDEVKVSNARGESGLGWTTGSGAPSSNLPNGSLYLDTASGDYYKRIAGVWVLQGNLTGPAGSQGPQGIPGQDGSDGQDGADGSPGIQGPPGDSTEWLTGNGVPSNGLGDNGDLYLDKVSGDVYLKVSGAWALDANIQGPVGPAGSVDLRKITFWSARGPFEQYTTPYRTIVGGAFPTQLVWFEDNTMAKKVIERNITYNPNLTVATDQWVLYQIDGVTPLTTATDTISYSGIYESSRQRSIV